MPRLSDLLERFRRRATPPGATGHAPGPVDAPRGALAELAPVFRLVDALQGEAEAVRADGQVRAQAASDRAARTVAEITGQIAAETAAARSAALAERREAGADELAEIRRLAEEDTAHIEAVATQRVPALAAEIVATILAADLTEVPGGG